MKLTINIDANQVGEILAREAVSKFELERKLAKSSVDVFYAHDDAHNLVMVQLTFEIEENKGESK